MNTPDTDTLRRTLEQILHREVADIRRFPSPSSSSFALEELNVQFHDEERAAIIFKNLGSHAMLEKARTAKPAFLYDPFREIHVYRDLLPRLNAGTPFYFGSLVEPAMGRYWLFIEKVPAIELFQIGDFAVWMEAARWLARFHTSDACKADRALTAVPELRRCDATSYRIWLDRAEAKAGEQIEHVLRGYGRVIKILESLPQTVIHGEFHPSNILVGELHANLRVCPVDWEMAAVGPGLLDLAALASGKWTSEQRSQLAHAYYDALPEPTRPSEFSVAFHCCQLQVALQWLGWSSDWTPPRKHAHDWLAEVIQLSSAEPLNHLFR